MRLSVAFKRPVNNIQTLLISGFLMDKQKLFVNVKQLMNCEKFYFELINRMIFMVKLYREKLRLEAKRKGLTTCLIRDAGSLIRKDFLMI